MVELRSGLYECSRRSLEELQKGDGLPLLRGSVKEEWGARVVNCCGR